MTALYRFYDEEGELLYIGISEHFPSRASQHETDKPWFEDVATAKVEHWTPRELALAREREAIKREHPKHNVVHNNVKPIRPAKMRWRCVHCRSFIGDGSGIIELVDTNWTAHHLKCDPHPESDGYWFDIHRARRFEEVDEWTEHLEGKSWFAATDWFAFLSEHGYDSRLGWVERDGKPVLGFVLRSIDDCA